MIQAENSTQTLQDLKPKTVTKVHGFSSPVNKPKQTAQNSQDNIPANQEIHPHRNYKFSEQFYHWWHRIAVVLLTIHGLVGIWESIKFIAVDFRELDQQLKLHQIEIEEVNHLIAMAVVVAGTTLVNIFMALRLSKTKETTAHNIDLIIATILIIGTRYIQGILIQFDLLNIFISSF